MKLRSLRMVEHFLVSTRIGTFHGAAQELGITQTAVTRSIRELESTLNARLFDRSVRGVKLTPYGELFHRRAVQIEMQDNFLQREMAELVSGRSGTLRIGAGTVWSTILLPQIIASTHAERPTAQFVVRRSVGDRFREQLEHGEIDLGLGSAPKERDLSRELIFEPLGRVRTVILARKGHPLAGRENVTHADVASFPWAMFRMDDFLFDLVATGFMTRGLTLNAPNYLADSVSSVMGFQALSDHVSCMPAPLVPLATRHGLVELDLPGMADFVSGAIYMRGAAEYPLLKQFMQQLRTQRIS